MSLATRSRILFNSYKDSIVNGLIVGGFLTSLIGMGVSVAILLQIEGNNKNEAIAQAEQETRTQDFLLCLIEVIAVSDDTDTKINLQSAKDCRYKILSVAPPQQTPSVVPDVVVTQPPQVIVSQNPSSSGGTGNDNDNETDPEDRTLVGRLGETAVSTVEMILQGDMNLNKLINKE